MDKLTGIHTQFARVFNTQEEMDAFKSKIAQGIDPDTGEKLPEPATTPIVLPVYYPQIFAEKKELDLSPLQLFGTEPETETETKPKQAKVTPAIKPTDSIERKKDFTAMLNGTATNQLTNISTRSNPPIVDTITGNATIEQGTLKVFIDSYSELTGGLRTSTHKLLDACTIALTQQNNYRGKDEKLKPLVIIPLEHFMELCGIPLTKPSKDKTRRRVKEDLETLYHISMEWTETSGRKTKDFAKMRLCDKIALVRGNMLQ